MKDFVIWLYESNGAVSLNPAMDEYDRLEVFNQESYFLLEVYKILL